MVKEIGYQHMKSLKCRFKSRKIQQKGPAPEKSLRKVSTPEKSLKAWITFLSFIKLVIATPSKLA